MTTANYTGRLAAGLGIVEETHILLDLWHEGMDTITLTRTARESGRFGGISASRLGNLVSDGFAPRYLVKQATPAHLLKSLRSVLTRREIEQLMFLYTCRAHPILADFVRDVYWGAYAAGRDTLDNEEARLFVIQANQNGKTMAPWSEGTILRVARYLTGCCADFGLLERGAKSKRTIHPYQLEARVGTILAYDLHFADLSDNRVIAALDWVLFGMEPPDVLAELKRMALKGQLIVQIAGDIIRVSWLYKTMEEMIDAITQGAL